MPKKLSLLILFFVLLFIGCTLHDTSELVPKTVNEDSDFRYTVIFNGKELRERYRDENPADMHEYAYKVNGTDLYIQTYGDPADPVIFMLHGGPGGGDLQYLLGLKENYGNGNDLVNAGSGHFLVFYDQRGAGISKRHSKSKDLTFEDYNKDLEALVEVFSPSQQFVIIGHSWGGTHAAMYLNTHLDRVAGVVFIEPGSFNKKIEDNFDVPLNLNLTEEFMNDFIWDHQFISPDDHARMDYITISGIQKGATKEYHINQDEPYPIWRIGAFAMLDSDKQYSRNFDFSANLGSYTGNVLFINGDLNEVITPDFQQQHIDMFTNASFPVGNLLMTKGGHDSVWFDAETHVAHIQSFLNAISY